MIPDVDVAVVGAGVAGLSAAHALAKTGRSVRVFEAADAVGGRMRSHRRDGYTLDTGAEQLATHGYPLTWALLRECGLTAADAPLIGAPLAMWRDGRARPGVSEPRGLVTGAGLGWRARLDLVRLLAAAARRRRDFGLEHPESTPLGSTTIAQLAKRHHPDLGDYLLQPVVSSFFGWDAERSAAAPYLCLMRTVGPVSGWRTYRSGMDTLARELAKRVDVVVDRPVRQVESLPGHARIVTDRAAVTAGSVVLSVPAPVARALHVNPDPEALGYLAASTFTTVLKVGCLLDRPLGPGARKPLYALLIPRCEDRTLNCVIADHVKQPGRVPAGRGLLSLIAAAPAVRDMFDAPDDEVARHLVAAAERYVPGVGSAVRTTVVHRFRHGLPEATPKALAERPGFLRRRLSTVEYAGDWVMARPASEGAIRSAALATDRIVARTGSAHRRSRRHRETA